MTTPEPPARRRPRWLAVVDALLWVGYPLLVFFGLERFGARELGLALVAALLVVALLRRPSLRALRLPLVIVALVLVGVVLDDVRWMMAQPVLVNGVLLAGFAGTLRRGEDPDGAPRQTMVERFARMKDPELAAHQVAWCRTWTWLWCVFFALNGTVDALLAAFAPVSWWTLYTSLIAYLLVGLMFAVERALRPPPLSASRTSPPVWGGGGQAAGPHTSSPDQGEVPPLSPSATSPPVWGGAGLADGPHTSSPDQGEVPAKPAEGAG